MQPEQPQRAQEYLETLDLEMSFRFIPFSQSRNKDSKHLSLNWIVTVAKGPITLVTDYSQGIGHLPNYPINAHMTTHLHHATQEAVEKGRWSKNWDKYNYFRKKIDNPKPTDVMCSLVLDSDVLNYACFEDWAECTGYSTDSREAEKIYNACLKLALKLRQMINLEEAQEAFEDY